MNKLEILNVVTDKNTKDRGQVNVVAVSGKRFADFFFLVLVWERTPEVCPSIFDTRDKSYVFSGE